MIKQEAFQVGQRASPASYFFQVEPENSGGLGGFAATLACAVVVLGEILRPSGELSEPKGRVLS
ncbi:hypothetical protein HJG40_05050 [Acidithiobacillus sp. ATCC 19703]|uniref:Uncharacterized protein n=2 Tax=Acidithiobacillus concretivorus TaxID=3063952 RepID=A0ABS5ZNJ9_9PROT|nr:hypothetical protein [Acidithiobacillus concretivorus]